MLRRIRGFVALASLLGLTLAVTAPPAAADADAPAKAKEARSKTSGDKAKAEKAAVVKAPVKMMSTTPDGKSISDSPYGNGAPAITGGFTDTTQGGTHTSGDFPVAPQRDGGPLAPPTK